MFLTTDNAVGGIYRCIVFEPGVLEFVPKCFTALSLVVLSQFCVVLEILPKNVIELVIKQRLVLRRL